MSYAKTARLRSDKIFSVFIFFSSELLYALFSFVICCKHDIRMLLLLERKSTKLQCAFFGFLSDYVWQSPWLYIEMSSNLHLLFRLSVQMIGRHDWANTVQIIKHFHEKKRKARQDLNCTNIFATDYIPNTFLFLEPTIKDQRWWFSSVYCSWIVITAISNHIIV